jgi:hypothetical protein
VQDKGLQPSQQIVGNQKHLARRLGLRKIGFVFI